MDDHTPPANAANPEIPRLREKEATPSPIGPTKLLALGLLLLTALLSWTSLIYNPASTQALSLDARIITAMDTMKATRIYGLNASDTALLALNLEATGRDDITVMPYPDDVAIVSPILTRTPFIKRWLSPEQAAAFEVVAVAGGWTLLHAPDAVDDPGIPHIATAQVALRGRNGRTKACEPYRNGRFQCGSERWMYVGPRVQKVGGTDEECIWAHPVEGQTLVITYPDTAVRFDDGRILHFEGALFDGAVGSGVPVDVTLLHGESETNHRHPDRRGFSSVAIDGKDNAASLVVEISASRVGRRHFCYRLTAR